MAFDINGITLTSSAGTTLDASSGATSWLKIDATGRVNKGQTPFMSAEFSGQGQVVNTTRAVFGSVTNNEPAASPPWNNSTGNFTCPIAGKYYAYMSGIVSTGTGYFGILRNGGICCFGHWNHNTTWVPVYTSAVLYAAAGDTISFCINNTPITTSNGGGFYGLGSHGGFSIALLK